MSRPRDSEEGIILETMREGDLDDVLAIERISFSVPWTRQSFVFDLRENPFSSAIVARDADGRLVGYACSWHLYDELKINNIAVRPDRRGLGLGRTILRRVIEDGKRARCHVAMLEVRPSNAAARTLYASEGFVEVGRRKNYYQKEHEDALVLALELGAWDE